MSGASILPPEKTEPLVLLAMAIISYNEKGPKDALPFLKKMAELNPLGSPPEIWLAIGICYFKMRNLAKSKFALEHVLSI